MAVYTTIDDPSAHFGTVIWSGNDADPRTIEFNGNSDLQPDLVITKARNDTNSWHTVDTNRGTTNASAVALDRSEAEGSLTNGNTQLYGYINAMTSDGFTVVDGSNTTSYNYNKSGTNFAGFGWKGNGGTRTTFTESGNNPAGGHQANTTAGLSIVDYVGTGAAGTIAHGLGAVPHMIIVKNRTDSSSWLVYHHKNTSAPETDILELQADNATYDNSTYWNDTAPTSTVFTVNTSSDLNANDKNYIAFCFRGVQGYSKFGGDTGNGNADGTFVYTGFKPAWVMHKRSNSTGNWFIFDNKRLGYNSENHRLQAGANAAEADPSDYDLLSNGFKIRFTSGNVNADTGIYVYIAFAESPFVTSTGIPTTAR